MFLFLTMNRPDVIGFSRLFNLSLLVSATARTHDAAKPPTLRDIPGPRTQQSCSFVMSVKTASESFIARRDLGSLETLNIRDGPFMYKSGL